VQFIGATQIQTQTHKVGQPPKNKRTSSMFRSNAASNVSFNPRSDLDGLSTKLLAAVLLVVAPLMAVYSLVDSAEPDNVVQLDRVVITADRIDTAQAPLSNTRRDRS
jgi:hypothetical protein